MSMFASVTYVLLNFSFALRISSFCFDISPALLRRSASRSAFSWEVFSWEENCAFSSEPALSASRSTFSSETRCACSSASSIDDSVFIHSYNIVNLENFQPCEDSGLGYRKQDWLIANISQPKAYYFYFAHFLLAVELWVKKFFHVESWLIRQLLPYPGLQHRGSVSLRTVDRKFAAIIICKCIMPNVCSYSIHLLNAAEKLLQKRVHIERRCNCCEVCNHQYNHLLQVEIFWGRLRDLHSSCVQVSLLMSTWCVQGVIKSIFVLCIISSVNTCV